MIQKTLIAVSIIFTLCFIYIKFISNSKENFQDMYKHFEYSKFNTFQETIFEESLREVFGPDNTLSCNINPTMTEEDCSQFSKINVNIFPVHLLEIDPTLVLGVFNNGYIYSKNKLDDKYWKGPLKNSLPNDNIPLRMITLDYEMRLLGVGYDNRLYRKVKNSKDLNVESRWEQVPFANNLIYVLYESKLDRETYQKDEEKFKDDYLIGVNVIGLLTKIKYSDLGSQDFDPLSNDDFKVLKIYFEKNGYMMAIGTDFQLYRKNDKNWETSTFNVFNKNPTKLIDVIYDGDARMFGLVFMERLGYVELMKQKMVHYLSSFVPLEFIITNDNKKSKDKMSFYDRLKLKSGVDLLLYDLVDDYGYRTIQEVESRLQMEDMKKIRNMCKNRGYLSNKTHNNFSILNKIEQQNNKITKMNQTISKLIEFDTDKHKIQESTIYL